MKKTLPWLFAALLLAAIRAPGDAFPWREDLPAAAADARQTQRPILLYFSGSDWCGVCRILDDEVFSQPAFQNFAAAHLVAIIADFPQFTPQDPALRARNEQLQYEFQVEGFPTLLLFSPEGELIGKLGYRPGGPEAFIHDIQQLRARHLLRAPRPPPI